MSEMVERMARKMDEATDDYHAAHPPGVVPDRLHAWSFVAERVLAALREPTEAMLGAAATVVMREASIGDEGERVGHRIAAACWRSMIGEALR